MTTVAEISGAVQQLTKRDLDRFRKWFATYDAAAWNAQFERDVKDGRLNRLAHEAQRETRAGRTTAQGGQPDLELRESLLQRRATPELGVALARGAHRI